MTAVKRRSLEVASRRAVQDAKLAIRYLYDAIVELVHSTQAVREQSFKCWLTVRSEAFPEIGEGDSVKVDCLTDEIRADLTEVPLGAVEAQEGALRRTWSVKAPPEAGAERHLRDRGVQAHGGGAGR